MERPIDSRRIRFLEPYEEIIGILNELSFIEGLLLGRIGTITIAIPDDLEDRIRPFIGKRIALIRTDIAEKQYLFRVLDQAPISKKNASLLEDP
jgi:hypothetical protein